MESWGDIVTRFRSPYARSPDAADLALADLLDAVEARWSGHVQVHMGMDRLVFVPPGEDYSTRYLLASFRLEHGDGETDGQPDGVFSFELYLPAANNPRISVLRSADKAFRATAPAVLNAFLMQLIGTDGQTSG